MADSEVRQKFEELRRCCSVCDARKQCHICGEQTLLACSDCRIDFGTTIYVCKKPGCRDLHAEVCPAELKVKLTMAYSEGMRAGEIAMREKAAKLCDSLELPDERFIGNEVRALHAAPEEKNAAISGAEESKK